MLDMLNLIKALNDENRLRILMALRGREMCVCQVTGFLDLSPSTTSKHLSILRQARLIESRKKGKWVYYALADLPGAGSSVREAIAWVSRALENKQVILQDTRRIHDILEREESFCSSLERSGAPDAFHSLEIHSLADGEELEQCKSEMP
jgi:ArsR family transcriptional regulator